MANVSTYQVIGLMSGTSLDGLDIAFCTFKQDGNGWSYAIEKAETIKYRPEWLKRLSQAYSLTAEEFAALDASYGKLLGTLVKDFITKSKLKPDFIASHGHTVFHQPKKSFTTQIGNGQAIYAITEIPVVYDFRTLDVLRGGQGAPLVPEGDKFLFGDFDVCLNLGGIANLSADIKNNRQAFDICFANMGLNYLSEKIGKPYDKNGDRASAGEVDKTLLRKLNGVYSKLKKKRPSLGRELFDSKLKPLLDNEKISIEDRLHTFSLSAASEIAEAILNTGKKPKVLCTGGGAFNSFLIAQLLDAIGDDAMLIIPEQQIVKFKEAMVFAFLGVLRVRDEVNCLKSVTGAKMNSSGGVLAGF